MQAVLPVTGLFSSKMKLFVNGRKNVFSTLKSKITGQDRVIWFHAASLGEYEQGVPVMEAFKKSYPQFTFVITFFSPSGFEIKKNNAFAKANTARTQLHKKKIYFNELTKFISTLTVKTVIP